MECCCVSCTQGLEQILGIALSGNSQKPCSSPEWYNRQNKWANLGVAQAHWTSHLRNFSRQFPNSEMCSNSSFKTCSVSLLCYDEDITLNDKLSRGLITKIFLRKYFCFVAVSTWYMVPILTFLIRQKLHHHTTFWKPANNFMGLIREFVDVSLCLG